jgi:hypothetical protein
LIIKNDNNFCLVVIEWESGIVCTQRGYIYFEKELFNSLRTKMGYYSIKGEALTTKFAFLGDSKIIVSKEKGYARNDTLLLKDKNSRGTFTLKNTSLPALLPTGFLIGSLQVDPKIR